MWKKEGKESRRQPTGDQCEGPEKTGTREKGSETTQIESQQQQQAILSTEGGARPSQPLQQKMLHQEPALPTQLGAVCESDDGPSKQTSKRTKRVQQQQLLPPLHPQQPAKSPSDDVGTPGFRSGQTRSYREQAKHRPGLVHRNAPQRAVSKGADQPSVGDTSDVATITRSIQTLRLPTRKNRNKCGTMGKPIIVETNHFALDLSRVRNNIIIHYDVTLEPSVPQKMLRAAMENFRLKHYPKRFPAFDGKKNLYSSGELPFGRDIYDDIACCDNESGRVREFKITIKYASQVDLQSLVKYMASGASLVPPTDVIQAVDIVLRNVSAFRFVQAGRSFFTPPKGRVVELGDGVEMWHGFFQSAILGWKPFLNIDVSHKGFSSARNIVDLILELCKLRHEDLQKELSIRQKAVFLKYIRGLKIEYMLPDVPTSKRTYRVNNITKNPLEQFFELDDCSWISVAEYFAREKKIILSYPHLPCLHVGSMKRLKPIYVPAELCTLTRGQVINRKLNDTQISNMIKHANTSTDIRKQKIQEALQSVGFNNDPYMKEFGLSVSDRFEKVEARVLEAPQLQYNVKVDKNNSVKPMKGVWRPLTFISSSKLSHWIILNLNKFTKEDEMRQFGVEMQNMGRTLGMDIGPPFPPKSMQPPTRNTHQLMEFFKTVKMEVQLVVVVIPDRGDCYAEVKKVAELNIGVLTQCVKGRTMSRLNPTICSNILLKINSKLNGINHTFASVSRPPCLFRPIMIVGADVTHPSPDQPEIPSVAAVSASHDPKAFKYNIQIRLQPPRVEIIEDLQNIMRQQLLFFYRHTSGCKPERILFFRDGVSEGQFAQVLKSEVNAIRRACSSMDQEYKPKVTFLVVQKRHHTRFFPRSEDADGRNKNVPPGTVVDSIITHPTEMDFYLVSHSSIQGVSRPTKYHLLWNDDDDDDDMTENEIEKIAYYLCHMFSRCTRSVSYPAPTYYAHLAAKRARVYLEGENIKLSNLQNQQHICAVLDEIISDHPMFFV